jgi:hypothetical protein
MSFLPGIIGEVGIAIISSTTAVVASIELSSKRRADRQLEKDIDEMLIRHVNAKRLKAKSRKSTTFSSAGYEPMTSLPGISKEPPRLAELFVRLSSGNRYTESALGDMAELYGRDIRKYGKSLATILYIWQSLTSTVSLLTGKIVKIGFLAAIIRKLIS